MKHSDLILCVEDVKTAISTERLYTVVASSAPDCPELELTPLPAGFVMVWKTISSGRLRAIISQWNLTQDRENVSLRRLLWIASLIAYIIGGVTGWVLHGT